MKKIHKAIISLVVIAILSSAMCFVSLASDTNDFVVENGILTKYTGPGGDVVIPENLGITRIGDSVFFRNNKLSSIIIPTGVTAIGSNAFNGCENLKHITIPNSVTLIDIFAFSGCGIQQINLPVGVKTICVYAFSWCQNLMSVSLPNTVTTIGDNAFYQCYNLISINIPTSIISIGSNAFSFDPLTSTTIPDSVISVGDFAFQSTGIKEPIIVNHGKTLCYVPVDYTSYSIPNGVTEIVSAFSDCKSLISVDIPNSVTYIGNYSFFNCSSLSSISIPESVADVGTCAFYGTNIGTTIYINHGSVLCYIPYNPPGFVIPNAVTKIAGGTFMDCNNLNSITIPENVTEIGDFAFSNCTTLKTISLPDGIRHIGSSAFDHCSALATLTIPHNINSINDSTFAFCSALASIVIPGNVSTIGENAFYSCKALKYVEMQFGVTSINDQVFADCENLSSVTIPDSMCSIDISAFGNCFGLKSIMIPASVTYLADTAFFDDFGLTIIGVSGSFLQQYAKNCGLQFEALPSKITAIPTSSTITINGQTSAFEVYMIDGHSYFKLRDLAMTLDNTNKQFNVTWDSETNAIQLSSNTPYNAVGGELTVSKNKLNKAATHTISKIFLDGKQIGFVAYQINGNNYFKLRDLGFYFDFGVTWDDASTTIKIDTSAGYTA